MSLLLDDAKTSPTNMLLTLRDPEGDAASVEFRYVLPSEPGVERRMTRLSAAGVALANPVRLTATAKGQTASLSWDFAAEPGLGTSFLDRVQIVAVVDNGQRADVIMGLGNDAPVLEVLPPTLQDGEVSGNVAVRFSVSDSSSDAVDVKVEYLVAGDTTPRLARPAGLGATDPTPEFAFSRLATQREPQTFAFLWDTATKSDRSGDIGGDLVDLERDVQLRFTVRDPARAEAVAARSFRVDNNEVPIVQIGEGFVANSDSERGIPIPFTVRDDESDRVRVLFQWRAANEADFPPLDLGDLEALAAQAEDPVFAREKQLCRPFPIAARGVSAPVAADRLRLVERQTGELTGFGIERVANSMLDLLRSPALASLAPRWRANALNGPVAARPLGDGRRALVLDGADSSLRLVEVDLATGDVLRTASTGFVGAPTALAVDVNERRALVATDGVGGWRLYDVDLVSGAPAIEVARAPTTGAPTGQLHGLLRLGDRAALATAQNELWRFDWTGTPAFTVVRGGLATPWGIVADPLRPGRVLVAERVGNRVVAIDSNTHTREIVPLGSNAAALRAPTALAVGLDGGPRLFALCDGVSGSQRHVVAFDLGIAAPAVADLGAVSGASVDVAAGADGLVLVSAALSNDLTAGGGLEQIRAIAAFDRATATVTLATAFEPAATPLQRWRIRRPVVETVRASPDNVQHFHVWDSRDAGVVESVRVRAIAFDTELGVIATTTNARAVVNVRTESIGTGLFLSALATVDLDGDGDLDVVAPDSVLVQPDSHSEVSVYLQADDGSFQPRVVVVGGGAEAVAVADLDNDGDPDFVTANSIANTLSVVRQNASHVFATAATLAGGQRPEAVVAFDVDGDGDNDIVAGDVLGAVRIFLQSATHTFPTATVLTAITGVAKIVAADVDDDGRIDLVCASSQFANSCVFYQVNAGVFVRADLGRRFTTVAAADVDGDGRTDLLVDEPPFVLRVLRQTAPRVFQPADAVALPGDLRGIAACDLNADGRVDFVGRCDGGICHGFQNEGGVFRLQTVEVLGIGGALAIADIDRDGRIDVLASDGQTGTRSIVATRSTALRYAVAPGVATPRGPQAPIVGDLDADGLADMVVNIQTGGLVVHQDAPRSFSVAELDGVSGRRIAGSVDLDGDGDEDLIAQTSNNLGDIWVLEARGGGYQPPVQVFASVAASSVVTPFDVDADGDLDLVVSVLSATPVHSRTLMLRNEGSLRFTVGSPMVESDEIAFALPADIDGDARVDLLQVVRDFAGPDFVRVLYSDSQGAFVAGTSLPIGDESVGLVRLADVDWDGRQDIVAVDLTSQTAKIIFQLDPRVFAAPVVLQAGDEPSGVDLADMDADGDLDVVCGVDGSSLRGARIFLQSESRRFSRTVDEPGDFVLSVGDVDGDGDPDFSESLFSSGVLAIHYGGSR